MILHELCHKLLNVKLGLKHCSWILHETYNISVLLTSVAMSESNKLCIAGNALSN